MYDVKVNEGIIKSLMEGAYDLSNKYRRRNRDYRRNIIMSVGFIENCDFAQNESDEDWVDIYYCDTYVMTIDVANFVDAVNNKHRLY